MTDSWQTIVEKQQKLTPKENSETPSFMPLSQLGVLHIGGDDAPSFLQNLLTNDVNALNINQSQLSGFCNAKGRLLALFLLIRRQETYQLVLPKIICTQLQQRLSMYVLRSKVTLSDESENLACLGLIAPSNNSVEQLTLSDNSYQSISSNRYLCIIPHDQTDHLLANLETQNWQLTSDKIWNLLDIESGLPIIYPETKEKFTPQQVNLDLIDGVSFSKGCYPGQEVVARLHYLGKPNRRMFMAQANTQNLPISGEIVTTISGDTAGHIVRSEIKDTNTIELLLSLKLSELDSDLFIEDSLAVTLLNNLKMG